MSTLTVVSTPTMTGAEQLEIRLRELQQAGLITIEDAAAVIRDPNGKPRVKQATNLVGQGALGGVFWGMLIGLLFGVPWFGGAIGAASGGIAGYFADFGIDDKFIKSTADEIGPGKSALFLLTSGAVIDRLAEELQDVEMEIIHTNLPAEQEAELRAAFGA
ncbi:MAG: DUF1269 domain-containing protein [Acidimicrobiia bacterium]|nr:DUF1269 domain-containing protein [Acidimicrobiia bacterium]